MLRRILFVVDDLWLHLLYVAVELGCLKRPHSIIVVCRFHINILA